MPKHCMPPPTFFIKIAYSCAMRLTKTEIHPDCHLQAFRLCLPIATALYVSKLTTVHCQYSSSGASTTWRYQSAINLF